MNTYKGKALLGSGSHPNVIDDVTRHLNNLGGNYLEIGVWDGVTMCSIAEKNPTRKVYGIDPFINDGNVATRLNEPLPAQRENCYHNISLVNNVEFYEMRTVDFLQKDFDKRELGVTVVYVDGSHYTLDIDIDVRLAMACFAGKGIIIFDDLDYPDVRLSIYKAKREYTFSRKGD